MKGDLLIEWRRAAPPRHPERDAAFRAILADLKSRLEERGVWVAILETPLPRDAAGQVLMNGAPVEELVPVQGCDEGCSGCTGGGAGSGRPACEEMPEPLLRLAALRASGMKR
ncbi:DUF2703 domain-containing protein [Methanoculleus sp. FWC-SCC1]|uniref:DUF2703 domain-containing protein n=1 Tax=Methanoculleus frigidifontis TaxID=2584085 RepID=A0ABT8MA41_9EURY|nr:hypothetical protein [Methanoculleus sp. FWC-SCC1]MDN7024801.1 DUF2703 domain-containing protein [Methanoculleus sp. FWC-SCC1]